MKINVKVIPGSKENQVVSFDTDILKVRLVARAHDNLANSALITFLSNVLDIPKNSVIILRGKTGRNKVVELPDDINLNKITK